MFTGIEYLDDNSVAEEEEEELSGGESDVSDFENDDLGNDQGKWELGTHLKTQTLPNVHTMKEKGYFITKKFTFFMSRNLKLAG